MDGNRAKDVFLFSVIGSFGFFLVKTLFRHPIKFILIIGAIYLGGRYMIYNHPEELRNGINAVVNEVTTTSVQLVKVLASSNTQ